MGLWSIYLDSSCSASFGSNPIKEILIYVNSQILNIIPIPLFRWSLVALATGLSGWFLLANLNPVLASSDSKAPRALLLLVAALHVALALTFKVLFFSYYIIKEVGPGAGEGLGDGES